MVRAHRCDQYGRERNRRQPSEIKPGNEDQQEGGNERENQIH